MTLTSTQRLALARDALEGLSVGDAFGEQFFLSFEVTVKTEATGEAATYTAGEAMLTEYIAERNVPDAPWRWTDDTAMALSIYETLRDEERIDADALARRFARRYNADPMRGYGAAMHGLLPMLQFEDWRTAARSLFDGQGSFGNGAAMRVAPIGAYWCDDLERAAEQAALSARITHAHPDGEAGAIAIAVGGRAVRSAAHDGREVDHARVSHAGDGSHARHRNARRHPLRARNARRPRL